MYRVLIILLVLLSLGCDKDIDTQKQQDQELENIEQILTNNNTLDLYEFNSQGYYYKIIQEGDGKSINQNSKVNAKLSIANFYTGKKYYDNFDSNKFISIDIANSIQAIKLMSTYIKGRGENQEGEIEGIFTSKLGYGQIGSNEVPINTVLNIRLQVEEVFNLENSFTEDTIAIYKIIQANPEKWSEYIYDIEKKIFYKTETIGKGFNPTAEDIVDIKYNFYNFADMTMLESSEDKYLSQSVSAYPEGIQSAITLLRKSGGKGNFIIPSSVGYGILGTPNIPTKINLFIQLELK